MTFLYNRWYAAGWASEVAAKPLGRKILSEDITFYQTEGGEIAAVSSLCPHRFAPLHFGAVVGDNIRCPYHGLEFSPDGTCVLNPDGNKPPAAKVKSYLVAVRHGMMWIWMGDKDAATEAPEVLANLYQPGFGGVVSGYLTIGCDYRLICDNLMDHSHVPHLHPLLRTEAGIKCSTGKVTHVGDHVFADYVDANSAPSPYFQAIYDKPGNTDQYVTNNWNAPSNLMVTAIVTEAGGKVEDGVKVIVHHMITPETETSSFYFWAMGRNAKTDDDALSETYRAGLEKVFETEDKWVLEGQQDLMAGREFWDLKPVMLPQDKATGLARRHLDKLIAEQNEMAVA